MIQVDDEIKLYSILNWQNLIFAINPTSEKTWLEIIFIIFPCSFAAVAARQIFGIWLHFN